MCMSEWVCCVTYRGHNLAGLPNLHVIWDIACIYSRSGCPNCIQKRPCNLLITTFAFPCRAYHNEYTVNPLNARQAHHSFSLISDTRWLAHSQAHKLTETRCRWVLARPFYLQHSSGQPGHRAAWSSLHFSIPCLKQTQCDYTAWTQNWLYSKHPAW